jgi:diguanylate cyclase (GGDEF)-like protein
VHLWWDTAGSAVAKALRVNNLESVLRFDVPTPITAGAAERETRTLLEQLEHLRAEVMRLERFERLALRDELTGLANRRHFYERLNQEWSRSSRFGSPLTVVLIDVDDLKLVNDRAGHLHGDRVIARVGQLMGSTCREFDVAARLGGDEFAYLLPNTEAAGAAALMARLDRVLVRDLGVELPGMDRIHVSHGIADATTATAALDLVERADLAMYAFKRERKKGRTTAA